MNAVPPGWATTTLGEIGTYLNGRGFKKSEWTDSGRPIIRIQNLTGSSSTFNHYAGEAEESYLARPGDVLISWAATLGVYVWRGPEAVVNQHIFKVESHIDRDFHRYFVMFALSAMQRETHGSGMVHITRRRFDAIPVPLPPLAEQRRIVAAIEEQFSRLDAAESSVARVGQRLQGLRASAIDLAFDPAWTTQPFESVAKVASNLVDPAIHATAPHVAPNHIESGTGRLLPYRTIGEDGVTSAKHLFRPGQVLYSKIRPYLKKAVVAEFDGLCSADMYPIDTELEPRFLKWWMLSERFTAEAIKQQGRSVLPKINKEVWRGFQSRYPGRTSNVPLSTQSSSSSR